MRSQAVMLINTGQTTGGEDKPPDFKKSVSDEKMNAILLRRWEETIICKESSAPLAEIVMMGALLKALLLARANRLNDMPKLFKAKATPIDAKTKKPRPLKEWTLKNYIDVGHELQWIAKSAKDVVKSLEITGIIFIQKKNSNMV
ncbi:MAG: hypothetical protein ACE5GU_13655 [Candidatus Scalinduaceae bacterium]